MFWQVLAIGDVGPGLVLGAKLIGLVVAIVFHEAAHAYAALWLGDPTAKYAGRLSLNPIKHADLWGTVLIPLFLLATGAPFLFGWAKPVPVNYYNLRGRYGPTLVALAGPGMNLLILVVSGLLARVTVETGTALPVLFGLIALINAVLMLFNLIPVPPLDGSKILYLFLEDRPDVIHWLERYGFFILIALLFLGGGILSALVFEPALSLTRFFTGF